MKPSWEPLWLRCGPCGHEWDDWQPTHCPIPTWVAHVKTLRCPKCLCKRKLFMRSTPMGKGRVLMTMGVDATPGAEAGKT